MVEGSRVFESWKRPPPPVYMEFFFFNVTNLDEFLGGAKPEVKQIGPYTYRYDAGAQQSTRSCTGCHNEIESHMFVSQETMKSDMMKCLMLYV